MATMTRRPAVLLLYGVQLRTSDRWFSPAMTRLSPTACTDGGDLGGPSLSVALYMTQVPNKTIFQSLNDNANSWRVYVTDDQNVPLGMGPSWGCSLRNSHLDHFAPASQFFTDLTTGTAGSRGNRSRIAKV